LKATARANKPFGYKAVVVRDSGSTYQPVRHNFKTRDEAIAYARKWIAANRPNEAKE
jgi:hypothetical protein